jgi:hypothetical protein
MLLVRLSEIAGALILFLKVMGLIWNNTSPGQHETRRTDFRDPIPLVCSIRYRLIRSESLLSCNDGRGRVPTVDGGKPPLTN